MPAGTLCAHWFAGYMGLLSDLRSEIEGRQSHENEEVRFPGRKDFLGCLLYFFLYATEGQDYSF